MASFFRSAHCAEAASLMPQAAQAALYGAGKVRRCMPPLPPHPPFPPLLRAWLPAPPRGGRGRRRRAAARSRTPMAQRRAARTNRSPFPPLPCLQDVAAAPAPDYMNLPAPVRYEELQREVMSE